MDKDTQLPAEVVSQIKDNSETYAGVMVWINEHTQGEEQLFHEYIAATSHEAGATEYAIKLHQCGKANKALEETNRGLIEEIEQAKQAFKVCDESGRRVAEEYDRLSKRYNGAYDLLEKFISRHEAGLLPDMFLYNDIKTFLDGKK